MDLSCLYSREKWGRESGKIEGGRRKKKTGGLGNGTKTQNANFCQSSNIQILSKKRTQNFNQLALASFEIFEPTSKQKFNLGLKY